MSDLNTRLKSVADRQQWRARGASFVAKLKATQAVWFPPGPASTGKKAARKTARTTKKATRKAPTNKKS
jgi:hypothetical protein